MLDGEVKQVFYYVWRAEPKVILFQLIQVTFPYPILSRRYV